MVLVSFNAYAATSDSISGPQISGHINTGMGFEHLSPQPAASYGSNFAQQGMTSLTSQQDKFLFYVGDVMLAVSQNFKDKATLHAELQFGRLSSYSNKNFDIGQVYGTFNIKKIELLVGRFNAPIGSESPYINENDLPTYSLGYTYLLPHYLTGAKAYYQFNDMFDLQVFAANDLRDSTYMKSNIPSFGANLGFYYDKLTLHASGVFSPEINASKYGKRTYLFDVNAGYNLNDKIAFFIEGIYRYDSAFKGLDANKYYFGLGKVVYKLSDKWETVAQYSFLRDAQGPNGNAIMNSMPASQMHVWGPNTSASGIKGDYHEVAVGGSYYITDGAKIQGMYKLSVVSPNGFKRGLAQSMVCNFAYNF